MPDAKEIYKQAGEWMKERRTEADLSLEEAAFLLGWTPDRLRTMEAGGGITAAQLVKFAGHFFVSDELSDLVLDASRADLQEDE